jgi:hypothetical protein
MRSQATGKAATNFENMVTISRNYLQTHTAGIIRCFVLCSFIMLQVGAYGQNEDSLRTEILNADTFQIQLSMDYGDTTLDSHIAINHKRGNWYKVEYTNPSGEKTHRVIHQHRIKKFSKKMGNRHIACRCQKFYYSEFTFTANNKTAKKEFTHCDTTYPYNKLRILKIWYYEKD